MSEIGAWEARGRAGDTPRASSSCPECPTGCSHGTVPLTPTEPEQEGRGSSHSVRLSCQHCWACGGDLCGCEASVEKLSGCRNTAELERSCRDCRPQCLRKERGTEAQSMTQHVHILEAVPARGLPACSCSLPSPCLRGGPGTRLRPQPWQQPPEDTSLPWVQDGRCAGLGEPLTSATFPCSTRGRPGAQHHGTLTLLTSKRGRGGA